MFPAHSFLAAITDDLLPQASSSPEVVGSNPIDFKIFLSWPASYGLLIPFTSLSLSRVLRIICST